MLCNLQTHKAQEKAVHRTICTYGSLMDVWTCEVSLHCKLIKGKVMHCVVFVHVSCACCMLDNVFLVSKGG